MVNGTAMVTPTAMVAITAMVTNTTMDTTIVLLRLYYYDCITTMVGHITNHMPYTMIYRPVESHARGAYNHSDGE